ncbi:MAG: putative signal transducing protein [Acidimicrobiales bacterium]
MVPVATVSSSFEARVIAARLGADGIVWQFRGSLDGPLGSLPGGEVTVLVVEDDYEAARDLLLADEVEASFADQNEPEPGPPARGGGWWIVVGVALVIVFTLARMGSLF